MHPADIKAALAKRQVTQSQVARDLGVSPSAVTAVIKGHSTSRNIASTISKITAIPVGQLWPGKYRESRA